jgi:hypothetical protein
MIKTAHELAGALVAWAIVFFFAGFIFMTTLLILTYAPSPQTQPLNTAVAMQYLLAITIFEATTALPCTIISFAILMNE